MDWIPSGPIALRVELERWPLVSPFRITGRTWEFCDVLLVQLDADGQVGLGEAAGVFYKNDTPESMLLQIEALRPRIEAGLTRDALQGLLPPGGARNGLDCALWDLQAKLSGSSAWEIAELDKPRPLLTTFTCGADTPEAMVLTARSYTNARALKLKLTGEASDGDRVRAVREACPDVWLGVDVNQAWELAQLEVLMPTLVAAHVRLIEQPFRIGQESLLDGWKSPIPIAADESAQELRDLEALVGRFDVVNIKLDKCGGLTEGLAMARAARRLGFEVMVGNMTGTSLAMAPGYLVGQLCDVVDLDGPVFLKRDRSVVVQYTDGVIDCSDSVWGSGSP